MQFLYLIFYAWLKLGFLDVETNPGPRCPVPDVCSNMLGLAWTLVTWPWRRLGMTYCCLWDFGLRYASYLVGCWSLDLLALSCCAGAGCLRLEEWRSTYGTDMDHFANPSLSVVLAKCYFLRFKVWYRIKGQLSNLCVEHNFYLLQQ